MDDASFSYLFFTANCTFLKVQFNRVEIVGYKMVIKGLIRPETVHTSTGSTQARARDQSKPYVFDLELD